MEAVEQNKVTIRHAVSLEEATTLWWALVTSLGRNRSRLDLKSFTTASRSRGCIVAVPDGLEEPVGHILATIYDNSTAWLTFFAVKNEYQRRGYGKALFDAALDECKILKTQFVGLDSVVEQRATYGRRGFVESTLGKVCCWSWPIKLELDLPTAINKPGLRMIDIKQVPYDVLVESDFNHTGLLRKGLWDHDFLNRPDLFGLALINGDRTSKIEDIRAWSIIRRVRLGFRMGPLYAADISSARTVILAVMKHAIRERQNASSNLAQSPLGAADAENLSVTVEIWDGNPHAVKLFQELKDLGWGSLGVNYHRMWLNGQATPQQSEGGQAHSGMYAVFDSAIG